ncbi:hypothetical protein ADEAN_000471200 [Angomonas deanei]|uniref:Uncharacterized protein n=1 Tax=Angomonas deanei TaxID=59799 RepID=A0A7G2CED1_9TRYP|nr:hypothetical protein ADEAN_000471200 [Angomonas deanei]
MSAFKQDNNNNSPSTVPHYLGREGTSPRPTAPEYAANNTAEEDYVAQRLTYSTSVGRSDLPPPPTDHKSVPPHVVRGPSGSPYHPHKVFVDPNFAPPYMPPANGFASPYPPHPWHYNTMSKSCAPPTPPYYTPNHTNNVNHTNTPMDYNHYCRAVAAHESLLHMAQQQASAAVSTAATTNNNNTYTKYNNNNNNNNNNPATVPRYVTLLSDPNKKENEKISVDHTKPKKFLAKPSIKPEYQTDTKNNNNKYNNEVEMEEVVKPQRVLFSSDVIHDKNDYQNNEGEDILQNSYCPSN